MADRTVVYRLQAQVTQFKAQMAQASASTKKLAADLTSMDKAAVKNRQAFDQLAGTAGKFGLAAAAGLGAAVVASANFDQAMSGVQAATHESTENMRALREAAVQAGADTAFSASEAAAGIENLAKAGVTTTDILDGGLSGALDLAAAGNLDVATAAEAAATAMTQFSLSGEDVPHIADLLAAGAGKAQGEVTDLSMALNQSGLVAAQMGLSIEETTGSLAAFASAGLLGSDAGTSLKTMLLRLANPSEKAANTMSDLGISAYDAQGNFVGMEELAGQLATAFEGQSQAQRDAALATIFGSDAIRAANVLYSQGAAGISDWTNKVDDSGYAAETAAIKLDNLKGDLEAFMGSLETALIGTGDGAQSSLRSLVQGATDVVNAFNDAPQSVKDTTAALLGLTAVTGGALWFGSKVVQGIADTRAALEQLGESAGKAQAAASALKGGLALGGAIVALGAVDSLLDSISDHDFGGADLNRNLEALADGEIVGGLENVGDALAVIQLRNNGMTGVDRAWGWIPGVTSDAEEASENIEKIDQALASMVEGGQGDQAAEIFKRVQEQADAAGVSADTLAGSFDSYNTAVSNAEGTGRSFLNAIGDMIGPVGEVNVAMKRSVEMTQAQEDALRAAEEQARESAEEFYGLGDSLDDSKVSLGEWLKQLEDQADALRNFRNNAKEAGKKGLDEGLIQSLQNAGEAGALRMRQLANATDEQIERANRAWRRGQRQVDSYVDDVTRYLKRVNDFQLTDKHFTVAVHTVYTAGGEGGAGFVSGGQRRAMGGPIYGPGTATSDSIPAMLSNGEYVVRASAVDKYGTAFFDSVNSMRFASGGQVGAASAVSARVDLVGLARELAPIIATQRPLYGDVVMQPHNYGEFQRQMLEDQQAAGVGGFPR